MMLFYTKDHTWVLITGSRAKVGISDFAQAELGDIAYVELPAPGKRLGRGEVACTVDSLKSSSEIYAPVSGTVAQVNGALASEENCTLINKDPLGQGWLIELEMSDPDEVQSLLTEKEYEAYITGG
jgi:glycine cleavage system H protein